MIRSMTGFGQAERRAGDVRIQVDIKSVNHRYGETVFRMPREWLVYEDKLRKLIAGRIRRGRVDVFVTAERSGAGEATEVDWTLAAAYKQAADELARRYGLSGELTLPEMLALPGLVQVKERLDAGESVEQSLIDCTAEAVDRLTQMREAEGAHLLADLQSRLAALTDYHTQAIAIAPTVAIQYQEKLRLRLAELLAGSDAEIDPQRLVAEVALMADRSNIDEELTRLRSHLEQFNTILGADEPVGRKLDFLLQEMNREVNTIGAKASQTELVGLVVEMKAELEKMREQVQNIE